MAFALLATGALSFAAAVGTPALAGPSATGDSSGATTASATTAMAASGDTAPAPAAAAATDATPTADSSRTPSMPASHTVWTIGTSVRGRPIVAETFGVGPRHVLIMGGIHGNEYGTPVAEAFLRYVRAHPSIVPSGTELDIITCANPDGRARNRRTNAHNVDLNRNFPSRNWNRKKDPSGGLPGSAPGSEPETKALLALLAQQRYLRIVSLHSAGGILDWDGPGGGTLARRIGKAAHVPLLRLGAYHGSMGSYVPQVYKIPIVTWELKQRAITARIRAGLIAALR